MTSRGTAETNALVENLQEQMDRLVEQLSDLEECKADLDEDEYEGTKRDTLEQLDEIGMSLKKFTSGDLTLVNSAIQAAVSQAFKTPEVIRMFSKKQPDQLRIKLAQIERDLKMHKLDSDTALLQKVEVLMALKKLDETLQPEEEQFLQSHASNSMKEFEKVSDQKVNETVLTSAAQQLASAIP